MWKENTFLFTACTGSAAAAFRRLAAFAGTFLSKDTISDNDRQEFDGVRTPVIGEVSLLRDAELNKMQLHLQNTGHAHSLFGGCNVVFGGTSGK